MKYLTSNFACKYHKFEFSSGNLNYKALYVNNSLYVVIPTSQYIKEKK